MNLYTIRIFNLSTGVHVAMYTFNSTIISHNIVLQHVYNNTPTSLQNYVFDKSYVVLLECVGYSPRILIK